MSRVLKAIAIFAIWWFFKDTINTWEPNMRILAHLIGIGGSFCVLFKPQLEKLGERLRRSFICVISRWRRALQI